MPGKNAAGNKNTSRFMVRWIMPSANSTTRPIPNTCRKEKRAPPFLPDSAVAFATRVFSNAMSFRAGLNYSQVNEKFRYVQDNIVQMVYIINTNGDTTGSYSTSYTRYKVTQNRYRTIDLR